MGLNIQYVSLGTDDFSPVDFYGYDSYDTADYINNQAQMRGAVYTGRLGQHSLFEEMRAASRQAHYDFRAIVQTQEYERVAGEGIIETWTSYADMRNIAKANHLNMLTYAPIRKLHREGRVSGWGYDPESVPDEDIIGRMINNGRSWVNLDGSYHIQFYRHSDDLPYTRDQLDKFEMQRLMVEMCLENTSLDPTDTELEIL